MQGGHWGPATPYASERELVAVYVAHRAEFLDGRFLPWAARADHDPEIRRRYWVQEVDRLEQRVRLAAEFSGRPLGADNALVARLEDARRRAAGGHDAA